MHFENNAPFLVATVVERVIEISHWGNIAVEEYVELEHRGAELKVFSLEKVLGFKNVYRTIDIFCVTGRADKTRYNNWNSYSYIVIRLFNRVIEIGGCKFS